MFPLQTERTEGLRVLVERELKENPTLGKLRMIAHLKESHLDELVRIGGSEDISWLTEGKVGNWLIRLRKKEKSHGLQKGSEEAGSPVEIAEDGVLRMVDILSKLSPAEILASRLQEFSPQTFRHNEVFRRQCDISKSEWRALLKDPRFSGCHIRLTEVGVVWGRERDILELKSRLPYSKYQD